MHISKLIDLILGIGVMVDSKIVSNTASLVLEAKT